MRIDFSPNIPIYIQVIEFIKIEIATGRLAIGDKIPTVRALANELEVNQNTIQRTFQELEKEEVSVTRRGIGRYITNREEKIKELRTKMIKELVDKFINDIKNLNATEKEILLILQSSLDMGKFEISSKE
ncbi:GntR family transcriptional regulator [Bacillus bingmayongensis]|uniref:GntR family transcriptional regulator n=1 Tax=Bacillus bingmayongensis TaxID=1150157 RepID=UPI0002FC5180|nr:GntR family transcriptional regulator [Bacillus bingmayongensis]MBY0595929.1 GntR family transcriptional regulator [Bacillus bingmayongensis]UXM19940.1 GntR family transcriptional regulator [Bacillus thuringiensis]